MVHDMGIIKMHLALGCWGCDRHEKGVSSYLTPFYISKAMAVCAVGEFGYADPSVHNVVMTSDLLLKSMHMLC
jgi:hypothetical protein